MYHVASEFLPHNISAQKKLKGFIASHLLTTFRDNRELFNKRIVLSQKLMELAFHVYGKN